MFRKIRAEVAGIRLELSALTKAVRMLPEWFQDNPRYGNEGEVLADLQRQISALEGTLEATLTKADSLKAAARASEERARGHLQRAEASEAFVRERMEGEEDVDPFEVAARAYNQLPEGHDPAGGELPPMSEGVDPNGEDAASARAMKQGRR